MDWTSSYIEMFKLTPNMESVSLHCEDDSEAGVNALSEGGIVLLLSHIECPALESLSMVYQHPHIRIPSSPRVRNLRTLSINAPCTIPAEALTDLLSLLRTTPSLTHLSMSMSMSPEENVLLLGLNNNINPGVVPGLRSLTFRVLSKRPVLSSVFVDLVESRRTWWETLRLSVPFVMPSPPDALVDRWAELCDGGFVLYGME
ncbi:hypothetical protein EV421DRAFT_1832695 [Armillaria borealis]|uniref:F-box domain-containing protein n=1 Tax=Armillaria borealis TaxID=47425 RepID=A0AA39J6F6_9AGAR|nr:hypothetical protein EV421DRAFT_1832695 [Armillaria borealis]